MRGRLRDPIPLPLLPQRLTADPQQLRRPALMAAGVGESVADLLLLHFEESPWTGLLWALRGWRIDRLAFGENQAPLQGVAQLSKIARPGIVVHPGPGSRRQVDLAHAEALPE